MVAAELMGEWQESNLTAGLSLKLVAKRFSSMIEKLLCVIVPEIPLFWRTRGMSSVFVNKNLGRCWIYA